MCTIKTSGRRLQTTRLNHGQRWSRASMPSASQGKQSAQKTGVSTVTAWTTQPTAAHSGHVNVHGIQPFPRGIQEKLISRFVSSLTSLMAIASSARNAVSGMFVAPVVTLILQPSAKLKVAASPSKTASHGGANRSCFFPFLSVIAIS